MRLKSIKYKEKFLLVNKTNKLPFHFPLTILVGENGSGKTTTLDIIQRLLLKEELDETMANKVKDIELVTDQGTIEYVNGSIKTDIDSACWPSVIKMDQIIHQYDLTEQDKFMILSDKIILNLIKEICDNRDDLILNLVDGDLYFKNKYTNKIFDYKQAPESIRRYIQMLLFAKKTGKDDILMIDGVEDHLHLAIQTGLIKNLMTLCKGQLIVTTHSPMILAGGNESVTLHISRYYEN